jgi:hypothetical protein
MGGAARDTRRVAATADVPDAGRSERPRPSWRETLLHAVDLCVAFITLADEEDTASSSASVEPADHPHRQPLRPKLGPRRSGAAEPRFQPCLSPVGRAPSTAPKRRARL